MNYYPFHIGDYRADTTHLSNEEDLCYRRLIDMYYDTEQPIPLKTDWVARRIRIAPEVVSIVLEDLFIKTETGWTHPRCEAEIERYHRQAEKNRINGLNGGRPKKRTGEDEKPSGFPSGSDPKPTHNPEATQQNPNQEPRTNNQEPGREEGERARPKPVARFTPPGKSEVADFFVTHGSDVRDAGGFWYHFEERDWCLGNGKKMKAWQKAAQKWMYNSRTKYANKTGGTNGTPANNKWAHTALNEALAIEAKAENAPAAGADDRRGDGVDHGPAGVEGQMVLGGDGPVLYPRVGPP